MTGPSPATSNPPATIGLRGSTRKRASEFASALASMELTYDAVGSTADASLGSNQNEQVRVLGNGAVDFAAASDGLRRWVCHRGAGLDVLTETELIVGSDVLIVLPVVAFDVRIACRIVETVDSPTAFGFAYGTLPMHPESGEERFVVTLQPDGSVVFSITYFSTARHPLARLGGPISKAMQRRFLIRYLDALQAHVQSARQPAG